MDKFAITCGTPCRGPALAGCDLREWIKGESRAVRTLEKPAGFISIRVENGVVTLDGDVPGLSRKRLAALAMARERVRAAMGLRRWH